jgi:hypothetical protein
MTSFTDLMPECPFCDGGTRWVGERGGQDHWQCERCGLFFTTPPCREPPNDDWDGADDW